MLAEEMENLLEKIFLEELEKEMCLNPPEPTTLTLEMIVEAYSKVNPTDILPKYLPLDDHRHPYRINLT